MKGDQRIPKGVIFPAGDMAALEEAMKQARGSYGKLLRMNEAPILDAAIQLKYDYDVTCVLLFRAWVDP